MIDPPMPKYDLRLSLAEKVSDKDAPDHFDQRSYQSDWVQ
jgi:hypothetical protein